MNRYHIWMYDKMTKKTNILGAMSQNMLEGLVLVCGDSCHVTMLHGSVGCHNRTFDGRGLAIVRHSLSNDKWAKPIRSCVAYSQATYARASGLGFKRRFWKRRYISKQERNNNGSQYITLGGEKLITSRISL